MMKVTVIVIVPGRMKHLSVKETSPVAAITQARKTIIPMDNGRLSEDSGFFQLKTWIVNRVVQVPVFGG